jgi:hypothetical protein
MIQTTALICASQANSPSHFPNPGERVMLVQAELPDDGHIESLNLMNYGFTARTCWFLMTIGPTLRLIFIPPLRICLMNLSLHSLMNQSLNHMYLTGVNFKVTVN